VAEAVEHYKLHELADRGQEGKAYSTRDRKSHVLNRWVLPQWGKFQLRAIKTVAVEQWLRTLVTSKFGKPKLLAGGTREKIRDAMSCLFNPAIRWEFTDRNPITGPVKGSGVRVSAKRERTPDILEVQEMHLLLGELGIREKAIVFLDMGSGLRRGELAGLKWEDFDFNNLQVSVTRSLVDQHVGPVKTEASRKLMPIDEYVTQDLLARHAVTPYKNNIRLCMGHPCQLCRSQARETASMAEYRNARLHPTGSPKGGGRRSLGIPFVTPIDIVSVRDDPTNSGHIPHFAR
jgi:integrase